MYFLKQYNFILSIVSALFLLGISAFAHEEKASIGHKTNFHISRCSEPLSNVQLFSSLVCPYMDRLRSGEKQVLLIGSWDLLEKSSCPIWLCFPKTQTSSSFCKGCALWRIVCQLKEAGFIQGKYQNSDIRWVLLRKDLFHNLLNFLTRVDVEELVPIERTESCVLTLSSSTDREEYLDISWALLSTKDTEDLSFKLENGSIFENAQIENIFPFSEKSRQFRNPNCN